ncbi:hypothetical protein TWF694_010745 [Orbilia ellipsospora]|uniref:Uncharacterized protein n=1 Tax=Orbilia ellipsospora TaxID=2528407 RepID=A0AAV9XD51_9PEZI
MSTHLRLRTSFRLILPRRPYSSKPHLEPKSEDAKRILKDIEALELKDPRQLFADEIFSREYDAESEAIKEEAWSDLPLSPIMDLKVWRRRLKGQRKLGKPHPSQMTEEELKLMRNPYANALATNVRQDSYYRRTMPSFFLQKLHPFNHPETKEPWILPVGIRSADKSKVLTGVSKYMGLNYNMTEFLKTRRWKKLLDGRFVTNAIWRVEMSDFILKQLRNRVYEEVAKSQRWIMSANKNGGKWEDMNIGCILVWENGDPEFQAANKDSSELSSKGASKVPDTVSNEVMDDISSLGESLGDVGEQQEGLGVKQEDLEERLEEQQEDLEGQEDQEAVVVTKTTGNRPWYFRRGRPASEVPSDVRFGVVRILVNIKGNIVPSYNMHLLFGREKAAELKKQLKIEDTVRRNVLLVSTRTMKPQTWLWKLAGYMRQETLTPLFKEMDALSDNPQAIDIKSLDIDGLGIENGNVDKSPARDGPSPTVVESSSKNGSLASGIEPSAAN